MLRALATLVIFAAVTSGCTLPGPPWLLHGSFTSGYTSSDIHDACEVLSGNATCAMSESEPPQFGTQFATQNQCETARARLAAIPHTNVGACTRSAQ